MPIVKLNNCTIYKHTVVYNSNAIVKIQDTHAIAKKLTTQNDCNTQSCLLLKLKIIVLSDHTVVKNPR